MQLTKLDVLTMILFFFIRHNITIEALIHLLKLINRIVGSIVIPETYYAFTKIFNCKGKFEKHFACSECSYYFKDYETDNQNCPCCGSTDKTMFAVIPIKDQIHQIISYYHKEILEYKLKFHGGLTNLCDIHDGQLLRDKRGQNMISISFTTDGVATAVSNTKRSMWPIAVMVNDLPLNLRFARKNVLLAGLWLKKGDPPMPVFLKSFVIEMKKLFLEGLVVDGIKYKILVSSCILDVPAKSKVLNVTQFNGKYGCNYCYHPGSLYKERHIRYSHMQNQNYERRTNESQRNLMEIASQTNTIKYGVKGFSPLIMLPEFDLVQQLPVDYMHNCLLGVTKALIGLWTDSSNHLNRFYIGSRAKKLKFNKQFEKIRSYSEISRQPRNVMNVAKLKANEYKNWLLYYSIPCLRNLLPPLYLDHFLIFRSAISKLLQKNINTNELVAIDLDLKKFVRQFESLYGLKNMTFNVHLLTHIVDNVRNFGPLWCQSMFTFEDFNGFLKSFIKSPNGPIIQVLRKYFLHKTCNFFDMTDITQSASEFCLQLFNNTRPISHKKRKYSLPEHFICSTQTFYKILKISYKGWMFRSVNSNHKYSSFDSIVFIKSLEQEFFALIDEVIIDDFENIYFLLTKQQSAEKNYNFYEIMSSDEQIFLKLSDDIEVIKCIKTGDKTCSKIFDVLTKE